jgi:serine/threonine protein kinase
MNKYQRVRLLGKGSFGAAYLATELATSKQVVIKEISLVRMPPEERNAAKQEAEVRFHDCSRLEAFFPVLHARAQPLENREDSINSGCFVTCNTSASCNRMISHVMNRACRNAS